MPVHYPRALRLLLALVPLLAACSEGGGEEVIREKVDRPSFQADSAFSLLAQQVAFGPCIPGAPGHGEGHNSGMPLIVTAAIAIKTVMEKNHIKGRLMLWPGIAEELLATKAFYVRDGLFKDVDACIFTHVSNDFTTAYGPSSNGMVSVEYTFHGKTAHAAGDPWDLRKAFDYLAYPEMDFKIPVGTVGDNYDRYRVRVAEMVESAKIVGQALDALPGGPFIADDRKYVLPPRSELSTSMESLIIPDLA